jgi:hypothetical protein
MFNRAKHRVHGAISCTLALAMVSVSNALPIMQPGEWRVKVGGELVDNKTGKRTSAGANTTVLMCLTRPFLDSFGLAAYTIEAQKAGLKSLDTTKCRSAVSEMTMSSSAYQLVCGLPDNQSSKVDFKLSADAKKYRSTTLATRSDGTGAVEAVNEGEYLGECTDERMIRLLPEIKYVVPSPLENVQPVDLGGDTFHLAEISDTTVSYENAFTLKNESIKKFSKYFSITAYRGVTLANFLSPQLESAKRNKAMGSPDPTARKLDDDRYLVEFVRKFDDRQIELYLMVAQHSPGSDMKLTMYMQRFTGSYGKNKADIESKAAHVSKQLIAIDRPVWTHAILSGR